MAKPIVEAITAATLPKFAEFLNANMNFARSTEQWIAGLSTHWGAPPPNFGFLLRDDGRIVGGIGAIYSKRIIRERTENFCNITSWCVLDSHRKYSMQLAMAVIGQPGYHFTDFSPTKVVGGTLRFLKFKPLDEAVAVIPNLPLPPFAGGIITDARAIEQALEGSPRTIWRDHTRFPWLRHVLVGTPAAWCHVIYKREQFKGFPSARVVYLSKPQAFDACFSRLAAHLLAHGMVSTHVEMRWLTRLPPLARIRTGFSAKLFRSDGLTASDIDYLYSESVALDL